MRILRLRLRSLLRRHRVDAELEEEFRFHFERLAENNLAAGMSRPRAHEAASRELGRIAQAKEECRDMRRVNIVANITWDFRYAVRMLSRNPGFTAVAVLTLALGIGANTAIFSTVNAVLLRPLPYDHADRLVQIWETHPVMHHVQAPYPDYLDWRSQSRAFEEVAAYTFEGLQQSNLIAGGEPVQLATSLVTGNLLPMLGVRPILGRNFSPDEMQPGHDNVVLLSHALWQDRFGASPNIVGQQVAINGVSFGIVGVLPVGQFPVWADLLMPVSRIGDLDRTSRKHHLLETIARLRPGVSAQAAQTELRGIAQRLQTAYPVTNNTIGAELVPLAEQVSGEVRTPLLAVLAAVGLVLLIACANVANLLLARAAARRKEIAIRIALGAARSRLLMQFLTESVLLSLFGSVVGLAVLVAAMPALRSWAARFLPRAAGIGIDGQVLFFTLAVALLTGIVFGLAPAWQALRRDQERTLRERSQRGGIRNLLVSAEIGLAVLVLIGAGLLVRSFERLLAVDPGFRSDHALTFRLFLPAARYTTYPAIQTFYGQLLPHLRQLPGVTAAETTSALPFTGSTLQTRFAVEGAPRPEAGRFPVAQFRTVTPGYFQAMAIAMREGRTFSNAEMDANGPPACLINETMARLYYQGRSAVGRKAVLGVVDPKQTLVPIVGVVADTRELGLAEAVAPQIYFPGMATPATVVLRGAGDPAGYVAAVRREVHALDPAQPLTQVQPLEEILQTSLARRRFSMTLFTGFAGLALLLSAVGLYGVISWSVTRRTQELGVRQALGARPRDLIGMVLREGLWLSLFGVLAGVALAAVATRLLESLLYQTKAMDPVTFAAAGVGLVAVSIVACLVPAWRAARVDPMAALRHE